MVEYLTGTLYKRRGGFGKFMGKKWEKRGFILSSDGILAYYDSEVPPVDHNVQSVRGSLDLRGVPFYLNTKGVVDSQPTPYTLIIAPIQNDKVEPWKLCTENSTDFEVWFKALEKYATPRSTPMTPSEYRSDDERESSECATPGTVTPLQGSTPRRGSSIGANFAPASYERSHSRGKAPSGDYGNDSSRDSFRAMSPSVGSESGGVGEGRPSSPMTGSSKRPLPPPPMVDHSKVNYMQSAPPPVDSAQPNTATASVGAAVAVNAPPKKRGAGIKLKKAAPMFTQEVIQAIALVCVLNACFFGAFSASSTVVTMFYVAVANAVVYQTVASRAVETSSTTSSHTVTKNVHSQQNVAGTGSATQEASAAATATASQPGGDAPASDTVLPAGGDANIPVETLGGKPVAGATFTEVFTRPPSVPEHTWCRADHTQFVTRIGPNYKKHGKKAPSAAPIYEPCGVDVICAKTRKDRIAERMALFDTSDIHTNHPHVPPLFIVQMQIPSDPPASMFTTTEDGPGWAIVMYFKITEDSCRQLLDFENASPALKLFAKYCEKAETDATWRARFKIICSCSNLDQMGLSSVIVSYNAKPVLIRRTGTFFRGPNYAEFDVHVHKFANLAKSSIHMISSRCGEMFMQIGFVIEGREDNELPETLFGCVAVNKPQEDRGQFIFPEDWEGEE